MRVLLTGATGFLGQHILWSLLQRSAGDDTIHCLIRGRNADDAQRRLQQVLAGPGAPELSDLQRSRARAIWGDITEPTLTFTHGAQALPDDFTRVIHCAATVKFNQPLPVARQINVEGTRNVLRAATRLQQRGSLQRFDYIGTAFVAGMTNGLVGEAELHPPVSFHNTYEQTKWEAEALLREARHDLPITILRPSIVVGDSQSGYTANYRVLYTPLKLLSQGVALFVPADARGLVDVVPVDYVIRAFHAITGSTASLGKAYHLAAGPQGQSTIGELLDLAAEFFKVRKPILLPPNLWLPILKPFFYVFYAALWGNRREQLDRVSHYFPYFAYRASFATDVASAELQPHGVALPNVRDYFQTLMQFCVDTDWGNQPPPRATKRETTDAREAS